MMSTIDCMPLYGQDRTATKFRRSEALTSHQQRITSTRPSRKPQCRSSVEELDTARDRSQIPGRAERARIVSLMSVQLAAAVQIIRQYVSD